MGLPLVADRLDADSRQANGPARIVPEPCVDRLAEIRVVRLRTEDELACRPEPTGEIDGHVVSPSAVATSGFGPAAGG